MRFSSPKPQLHQQLSSFFFFLCATPSCLVAIDCPSANLKKLFFFSFHSFLYFFNKLFNFMTWNIYQYRRQAKKNEWMRLSTAYTHVWNVSIVKTYVRKKSCIFDVHTLLINSPYSPHIYFIINFCSVFFFAALKFLCNYFHTSEIKSTFKIY